MIHCFGPLLGLLLAMVLIASRVQPVTALLVGAAVGGLLGGGSIGQTAQAMGTGAVGMLSSAALRPPPRRVQPLPAAVLARCF